MLDGSLEKKQYHEVIKILNENNNSIDLSFLMESLGVDAERMGEIIKELSNKGVAYSPDGYNLVRIT